MIVRNSEIIVKPGNPCDEKTVIDRNRAVLRAKSAARAAGASDARRMIVIIDLVEQHERGGV